MFIKNKKKIAILLFVLIVGLGGLMFKFLAPKSPALSERNIGRQTGNILDKFRSFEKDSTVDEPPDRIVQISASQITSATNGQYSKSVVYHIKNTGTLIESQVENGQDKTLFNDQGSLILEVIWSGDKRSAIYKATTGDRTYQKYVDYVSGISSQVSFSPQSLVFSPDGTHIAYVTSDNRTRSIMVARSDNTMVRKILQTRLPSIKLFWPSDDNLYLTSKNPNLETWDVFELYLDGKFERILTDKRDLEIIFSSNGSAILFSALDRENISRLYYKESGSSPVSDMSLHGFASQCAWSRDAIHIFCGIPASVNAANSNYRNTAETDNIHVLDVGTQGNEILFETNSEVPDIQVIKPFLSEQEDYVFFVNGFDNKLHGFKIH